MNFLQLNQDKTKVFMGPEGQREKLLPKLQDLKPTQSLKNLGMIFDYELFRSPTDTLVQSETYNFARSNSMVVESVLLYLNQDIDH